MNWTIVVPLKTLPAAKSRLTAASPDPAHHADLVEAIRADTLAAARRAGRVVLIYDDHPAPASEDVTLVQVERGINQAVHEAAAYARAHWPADGVAALVGDLPALQAEELIAALAGASDHPRCFVADADGTGTTLLTARPGIDLRAAFGPGSAARHARIADQLPAGPGLRLDVDTADDLARARALRLGSATAAALANRAR